MAQYEHRLPTDVERAAVGGPRFRTNLLARKSGFEQRNIDWSKVRGAWELAGRFMDLEDASAVSDLHDLRDLFMAQQGRAHGFRFKDFTDFEIGDYLTPTTDWQSIGTGDAAKVAFQVFKRYTFGAVSYDRDIKKLVSGRAVFLLDGVVKADPGDYGVDLDTGIVTWVSAPGGGVDVQVACEFDVAVRFDTDHLQIGLDPGSVGQVSSIPIVELRL